MNQMAPLILELILFTNNWQVQATCYPQKNN